MFVFLMAKHIVFNDLDCNINKGSFVGINGDSGKGKTTLIDMLLGFYLLNPVIFFLIMKK